MDIGLTLIGISPDFGSDKDSKNRGVKNMKSKEVFVG
jgi:hypothetical protein